MDVTIPKRKSYKKRKVRKKLSPEERKHAKIKKDHIALVRSVFNRTGFKRFPKLSDKQFQFMGQQSDFDDVYVFENVLVCIEYTTTASNKIGSHLKPKHIVYEKIKSDPEGFSDLLAEMDPDLKNFLYSNYSASELVVRIVYCSRNSVKRTYKDNVPEPVYLDYSELGYFYNLVDCIKKSARHELLDFLQVDDKELGEGGRIGISKDTQDYEGSLLPETNSFFDGGFKVVSFYVDPETLIKRAYVLRRGGWRNSDSLYQRMLGKTKIAGIRGYLKKKHRVFVNNIVATLPDDTLVLNNNRHPVDPKEIKSTVPITVQIPNRMNSIGLIDGQHRTYSYYEAVSDDEEIARMRRKQHLLVTGIIYPAGLKRSEKEKFEARLFLEINSNQTNAKTDLKQAIGLVLEPFSSESIATRVVNELNNGTGPLGDAFEKYWFDKDKLKFTSIVSYGVKPLVKTSGGVSLFTAWGNPEKEKMVDGEIHDLLDEYVCFCVAQIDMILSAAKQNLPKESWTSDKAYKGRMLTTTGVNSLVILLRLLVEREMAYGFDYYLERLKDIRSFDITIFHSSQYKRMAIAMYNQFFAVDGEEILDD